MYLLYQFLVSLVNNLITISSQSRVCPSYFGFGFFFFLEKHLFWSHLTFIVGWPEQSLKSLPVSTLWVCSMTRMICFSQLLANDLIYNMVCNFFMFSFEQWQKNQIEKSLNNHISSLMYLILLIIMILYLLCVK